MAGSSAEFGSGEVFGIAEDRNREDCTRRAVQAFSWANECRAQYRSLLYFEKRARAVIAAYAWADVLWYLDETGAASFTNAGYEEACRPRWPLLSRLRRPFWMLDLVTAFPLLHALFSAKPVVFYEISDDHDQPVVNSAEG